MSTKKGKATSTEDSTKGSNPHEEDEEGASITTTTQGAPYAIKYERIVDDDEEFNELEIHEEANELISNDGSMFEEDHDNEREVENVTGELEIEEEEVDRKKVIKLQTINVRGVQTGGLGNMRKVVLEEEEEAAEQPSLHLVKHEVDSDEEYVYPPKKRSKCTTQASLRKKRRVARGGRRGPSATTAKETKLNVVRRAEEKTKHRRILLQSGGGGGVSKNLPGSFRNAGVQCNMPRLDPIREGILAEMSLINDLFKLEVQEMLNRPRIRKKKLSARVEAHPPHWRQHDNKRVMDTLRVVKKEITEDDTVEIIVCDSAFI